MKLKNPAKRVYSVHGYPKEIGEYPGPESGPGYIERMNRMWGWLVIENIAPVWIGENGPQWPLPRRGSRTTSPGLHEWQGTRRTGLYRESARCRWRLVGLGMLDWTESERVR